MEDRKELYDKREQRLKDAIQLKETDCVPISALLQGYAVTDSGHTMAEAIYDYEVARKATIWFAEHYQPDMLSDYTFAFYGKGKMLDLMRLEKVDWAGRPGGRVPANSIHQFLESTTLTDDEMDYFNRDYTGWMFRCGLPRVSKVLQPLSQLNNLFSGPVYDFTYLCSDMSTPEFKAMMETIWKINDMNNEVLAKIQDMEGELRDLGYPTPIQGYATVPLDDYGAAVRSTQDCLMDLFDNEETVLNFCAQHLEGQIASLKEQGLYLAGKWAVIYLTKSSDTFMGSGQFEQFYWKDLRRLIEEIQKNGMIPYIYTEGPYNSRLEYLKDVPPGVIYHFEDTVDMKRAKQILGGHACISGGFPIGLLLYGKKEQVADKCKQLIDDCAPGGGYIFETASGFDEAIRENVETMYETVKEYGKR